MWEHRRLTTLWASMAYYRDNFIFLYLTYWLRGWVGPRTSLDDVDRRKIIPLPVLELRPLGYPARSQSLYLLLYPASSKIIFTLQNSHPVFKHRSKHHCLFVNRDSHFWKPPVAFPIRAPYMSGLCLFICTLFKEVVSKSVLYKCSMTGWE
jgi:hypothetical protein